MTNCTYCNNTGVIGKTRKYKCRFCEDVTIDLGNCPVLVHDKATAEVAGKWAQEKAEKYFSSKISNA